MKTDFDLIEGSFVGAEDSHRASLRFYDWNPSGAITLGRFLDRPALIDEAACAEQTIGVAQRPTGGGLLLHSSSDLSFSLFLPSGHRAIAPDPKSNYVRLHSYIYRAIEAFVSGALLHEPSLIAEGASRPKYCMASVTPYDIIMNGRKIGGSAIRVTKRGLLFQASIFIQRCPWEQFRSCLRDADVSLALMQAGSTSIGELLPAGSQQIQKPVLRELLARSLQLI